MTAVGPSRTERRALVLDERRLERRRARATEGRTRERRREQAGKAAFGALILGVLVLGGYLAFGDFLTRQPPPPGAGAIGVQASMAGFTPSAIRVRAGETVVLDFWTRDSPGHLENGVHTLIGHELGLHVELPGAGAVTTSRVAAEFIAPTEPGAYDIYCDTCCGGRENPAMHGAVIVEA